MSDPRMKAVLHEMAEKKAWQNCLAQDIHNMIHARLAADYRGFGGILVDVIRKWAKHPFDVVEIPLRAAERFGEIHGFPLLYLPMKYVEAAVEMMCEEINSRFRMTLVDHGLERMDLVKPGDIWLRQQELCREYRDLCGLVNRRWDQMRRPDSMFESACTVFVELRYDMEEKFPDAGDLFARFTKPFFGEGVGRLMYSLGSFIVDTTYNMVEDTRLKRLEQAMGKELFFEVDAMRAFEASWERRVQVEHPGFLRELFALRWQELTGEEMPVEFFAVM